MTTAMAAIPAQDTNAAALPAFGWALARDLVDPLCSPVRGL